MNSFALCALKSGYSPQPANNLLEQQLAGGFARQRVGFINNVHMVTASVLLDDKAKQQYFWAFWRSHNQFPRQFLWRLMVDDIEMTTYVCQFVAESLSVSERNGVMHRVSFSVRCKPNNTDHEFDQNIIDLWETGGGVRFKNLLEELVNTDLPNALQGLR